MSDLRAMLADAVGAVTRPTAALETTMRRIGRRQRRRRAATILAAFSLSAVAMLFLWTGFFGEEASVGTGPEPSGPEPEPRVHPEIVANVDVGGFPVAMTTGDGSLWVSVEGGAGGSNEVARVDPLAAEVISTLSVAGSPGTLAFEAGSLWIGLPGAVERVDPETGQVTARIEGAGTSVTASPGAVWAVDSANSVVRIDPATNEVVATVTLDLPESGYIISTPVATPDALWVMTFLGGDDPAGSHGALFRVDPSTNAVVARIDLGIAGAFAVGDEAVWAVDTLTADHTFLTRIDTATNTPAGQALDVEGQWTPFAIGAGKLWLMGGMEPRINVAGLDLSSLELETPVVVAELPAYEGSGIFDAAGGAIWIAHHQSFVTKVELRPKEIVAVGDVR